MDISLPPNEKRLARSRHASFILRDRSRNDASAFASALERLVYAGILALETVLAIIDLGSLVVTLHVRAIILARIDVVVRVDAVLILITDAAAIGRTIDRGDRILATSNGKHNSGDRKCDGVDLRHGS